MNPQRSISKEKSRGRLSAPACAALTDCLPASDVVPHADDAVTEEHETGVVDVAAEGGGVAEDGAVFDRQRPGRAVEDTAAIGPGGVAGQSALGDRGRAEVVDGAAAVAGGVAREGA